MRVQRSLWRALVLVVAFSSWGCSDPLKVEPLLGEGGQYVQRIQDEQGQGEAVRRAALLLKEFLLAVSGQECAAAGWGKLSAEYRQRAVEAAGGEAQAIDATCSGKVVQNGALLARGWQETLMGRYPAYLTPAPEEIPLLMSAGRELFFMVQQDGSYRAFVLVSESSGTKIEPFF